MLAETFLFEIVCQFINLTNLGDCLFIDASVLCIVKALSNITINTIFLKWQHFYC